MEREPSANGSTKEFKTFFVMEVDSPPVPPPYKFVIDPNITVGEFRKRIAETSRIPDQAYFKLIFNGISLANNVRLSDYGNDSTFHIIRTMVVFVVDGVNKNTYTIKGLTPSDPVLILKSKLYIMDEIIEQY